METNPCPVGTEAPGVRAHMHTHIHVHVHTHAHTPPPQFPIPPLRAHSTPAIHNLGSRGQFQSGKTEILGSGVRAFRGVNDRGLGVGLGSVQFGDITLNMNTPSLISSECHVVSNY